MKCTYETLTNSKDCSESRVRISARAFFCQWLTYSSVHPSLDEEKIHQDLHLLSVFGTLFRLTGGFRKKLLDSSAVICKPEQAP
jgi:hypothetical protein